MAIFSKEVVNIVVPDRSEYFPCNEFMKYEKPLKISRPTL